MVHYPLSGHKFALYWFYGDRYGECVLTSAQDHAFEGGDIGKVAAPGHGDVSVIGHEVIGWVKVDPAVIGQVHREPGVGGICANQVFFVGGGLGLEVAARMR